MINKVKIFLKKVRIKKFNNSAIIKFFPLIITLLAIIAVLIINYIFNTYKDAITVYQSGFFMNNKYNVAQLKNLNNKPDKFLETVNVKENSIVYKNPANHYFNENKKSEVNISLPLFVNKGLTLINYNEDINLINNKFIRYTGYPNIALSYGKVYDIRDYNQIDNNNYILLSYSNGIFINLYDITLNINNENVLVPINSIIYFNKDSISLYERQNNIFEQKNIFDIQLSDKIIFSYEANDEKYEYSYSEFLQGIGTLYIKPVENKNTKHEEIVEPIEENEKQFVEEKQEEDSFVWIKPTVTLKDFEVKTFSASSHIEINDPAKVIIKEPSIEILENKKTYLRRNYSISKDFTISGLMASTTYDIVATYTYLSEDLQTKTIVTFYEGKITTNSLDNLDPINVDFENGSIFSNKIQIKNLRITSDISSETLNGVSKVALKIDNVNYFFTNTQVLSLLKGESITVESSNTLKSKSKYEYEIVFYDRLNNELKIVNNKGNSYTSKEEPSVGLRISSRKIDNIDIKINLKNEDKVKLDNYHYVVSDSTGKTVVSDFIVDDIVTLKDLNPNKIYNFTVYADIDTDDGQNKKVDFELGKFEFSTLSLSSLGFLNVAIELDQELENNIIFNSNINLSKSNEILVKLLKKVNYSLYDKKTNTLVRKIEIVKEDLEKLKNGESINLDFDMLSSNTGYILKVDSIAYQGDEKYETECLINRNEFNTRKTPAMVLISNSFVTEEMIDFDIQVLDYDGAIISKYAKVELRDENNKLIETSKIQINAEPQRITYNNLNIYSTYYLYVYADEYNETLDASTYESKYQLKCVEYYTDSGISGSLELIDYRKEAKGKNLLDINSDLKWLETGVSGTLHRKVDNDGVMHIYSKSSSSLYIYDLSEYVGKTVKVTFDAKVVNPTESGDLYLTNYITGSTSTSYSRKITNLTNEWKSYEFVYVMGSYDSAQNQTIFYPITSTNYGKNNGAGIGFYISGGTKEMSEYLINNMQVQLFDEEPIDNTNYVYESGYWNNAKKTNDSTYIRLSELVDIKESGYYKFDFAEYGNNEYTVYFRICNSDGTLYKNIGYHLTGDVIYIPAGKKVGIFWRRGSGSLTPEIDGVDLKITKLVDNVLTDYHKFEYNLDAKVKVNLQDLRNEITNHDFYIRAYDSRKRLIVDDNYEDLLDTNIINDSIKRVGVKEKDIYQIELGIKVRDRYYKLDSFELNTHNEVGSVKDTNDFKWIQPYGNYVVLNDIDLSDTTYYIGNSANRFNGMIDFQGYKMTTTTKSNDTLRKFNYIGPNGVLKNIVLDIHLTHTTGLSLYGFFMYNYGTIDSVYLNVYDDRAEVTKDGMLSLINYTNYGTGVIKNFVINIANNLRYYDDSAIVSYYNRGTIKSGYVYGNDVNVDIDLNEGNTARRISLIQAYGYTKSLLTDTYSLSSINYNTNNSYDVGGIINYETYGEVSNSYVVGDTNWERPAYGPVVGYNRNAAITKNLYYMSDHLYTSSIQERVYPLSINNPTFQKSILSDAFNIEEMIDLGYYPQIIFDSNKMPNQPFNELPKSNTEEIDIVSIKVVDKTFDSATVELIINNPLGESITNINISDVDSKIISQTFKDGNSYLTVQISNPSVYKSKYVIRSIKSQYNGYTATKNYNEGDKYLIVDFYKGISDFNGWKDLVNNPTQNYVLLNDIDFDGYTGYYVGTFSGKLEGNNHKLKNIYITTSRYGFINNMYGTMQNLYIENVVKENYGNSYNGLIGATNVNTVIKNVHVNNIEIIIPSNTTGSIYIGGLIGYSTYSRVYNSSVSNVVIKSDAVLSTVYVGGLAGRFYSGILSDSFAENINIEIANANYSGGIGGLVGNQDSGGDGQIENCYSTGIIKSNTARIGGLVGNVYGYVNSCFSTVDIVSQSGQLGGIAGYLNSASYITNSFYAGDIMSYTLGAQIGRIAANVAVNETNYVYEGTLINGLSSYETYGEQLLSYEELLNEDTYKSVIGLQESYDFSKSYLGILPKLLKEDKLSLEPYQQDHYLSVSNIKIKDYILEKNPDSATITLILDNPNQYQIDSVDIEYMDVSIEKNSNNGNETIIVLNATPQRYLDLYLLDKLEYKDINGDKHTYNLKYMLEMKFYKYINSISDWQKVSTTYAENYFITTDLDFSNFDQTKINTNVLFNRLEPINNEDKITISNINYVFKTNANYQGLIRRIDSQISNIVFKNINISTTTTTNNSFFNIINMNYGSMENVSFEDITLDAVKKSYVGVLGRNEGRKIENINLNNITANGTSYVSGFLTYQVNSLDRTYNNINASNLNIKGTSNYVAGIFSHMGGTLFNDQDRSTTNINLKDSHIEGNNYTGGISGIGDCNFCNVDNVFVRGNQYVGALAGQQLSYYEYDNTVTNCEVSGETYVGGMEGYARYFQNNYIFDSKVYGLSDTSTGVGGLIGYGPGYTISKNGVTRCEISNPGTQTGGIIGYAAGGQYVNQCFVQDSSIVGSNYVGGVIGYTPRCQVYYTDVTTSNIKANNNYAGGLYGYINNKDVASLPFYDIIITNNNISAASYAGGFYGGKANPFYSPQSNYSLYLDSTINSNDENAGFASGEPDDIELYTSRGFGIYKDATVNGKKLSIEEPETETQLIDQFYEGYVNSSTDEVYTNYNYVYAGHSDKIPFKKGYTYDFELNYSAVGSMYMLYFYNSDGNIIGTSGTSVNAYVDRSYSTSYTSGGSFKAIKDGYYRIVLYNTNQVQSVTVTIHKNNDMNISTKQIIDSETVRKRITWSPYYSTANTSTYDISLLSYENSYYDFTPLGNEESNYEVEDLSGNNNTGYATVSGITKEGMYFDYSDDYIEIPNLNLNGTFTISMTFKHTNTSTGVLFTYGNPVTNESSFSVYIGTTYMYSSINGSAFSMGADIPVRDTAVLTVSYDQKKIKLYINGVLKYSRNLTTKMRTGSNFTGYIGKNFSTGTFMGVISDVQLYNRVLSDIEIADNAMSGVTNSDDLLLHYNLTNKGKNKQGYYPILKTTNVRNQNLTPLPDDKKMLMSFAKYRTSKLSTMKNKYHIYSSSVNTLNVEFDEIPDDLYFNYEINGKESEYIKVDKKVYTLFYDYCSDITFNIKTSSEILSDSYSYKDLQKTISIFDNNYYYILDKKLYNQNDVIKENIVNLYNNLALLENGNIYNVVTQKEQKSNNVDGFSPYESSLYSSLTDDGTVIKTYYNFSIIGNKDDSIVRDGQYIAKDNIIYIFNSNNQNNNIIFNNYNTKTYKFALGVDGSIKVYGSKLNSKEYFNNSGIKEITFDYLSNEPIMMLKYLDNTIRVLNYVTGETLYSSNDKKISLLSFIKKSLVNNNLNTINSKSYDLNNDLIKKINDTSNSEVLNNLNMIKDRTVYNDQSTEIDVKNDYVTVYNEQNNEYEVYSVEEVFNTKLNDDNIESKNDRIESNQFLYEYYYKKGITNISKSKIFIYSSIIILVLINLVIFVKKGLNKNEKRIK